MSLPLYYIDLDTDFGTDGFTFSVLNNATGHREEQRDQTGVDNSLFVADYNGAEFVPNVVYRFLGFHPTKMRDAEILRVAWDDIGGYKILSPDEDGLPGSSASSPPLIGLQTATDGQIPSVITLNGIKYLAFVNSDGSATLQVVTDRGDSTTNPIQLIGPAGADLIRQIDSGQTGGLRLDVDGAVAAQLGIIGAGRIGMVDAVTGSKLYLENDTLHATSPKVDAGSSEVTQRTGIDMALIASSLAPIGFYGPQARSSTGYDKVVYSPAQMASALLPYIAAELTALFGGSIGTGSGSGRQTREKGCFTANRPPDASFRATLTSGMVGSPQAHGLQTASSNITALLINSAGQPDSEMVLSFPDAHHFQVDYPSGTSGYDGGSIELLRINMSSSLDASGGPTYSPARVYTLINATTGADVTDGAGTVLAYYSPPDYTYVAGFNPSEATLLSWKRYTGSLGSLSSACISTPGPSSGDPAWTLSALPGTAVAASEYSVSLYWDSVGTPYSGQTITGILPGTLPGWLVASSSTSERKLTLRGTVPAGLTDFEVPLMLVQSDGRTTPKTFTKTVSTATVRLRGEYDPATNSVSFYEGADGSGQPTIQLRNAPAAYTDRNAYTMDRLVSAVSLGGQSYYFRHVYSDLVTGSYDVKTMWLGLTLYGSLDIVVGAASAVTLSLSTTDPGAWTGSAPTSDGDPVMEQPVIDYAWDIITTPFTYPILQTWVKMLSADETVQLSIRRNGADRGYGTMNHQADYGSGYQNYQDAYEGEVGDVYTLHFRKTGETTDFAVITLPALPSSNHVARTTIFPIS